MRSSTKSVTTAIALLIASAAGAQSPPTQPSSGPGGSSYPHAGYTVTDNGSGRLEYWVYQPASPKPAAAPLIVLNHGANAFDPPTYIAWIEHLVRRGNIVVYPRYQATVLTPPSTYTDNAISAVKSAISWLQANGTRVQPQLNRFAVAGHSYGGVVTVNMAQRWQSAGLPQPRALLAVEPWYQNIDGSLASIPAAAYLNCVVGGNDDFAGRAGCDTIWDRTGHISAANRDYVWMSSDTHGTPDLVANHAAPAANPSGGSTSGVDALDWYGFWKTFDGLTDCAFYGTNCPYGLGNSAEHRGMGTWSDGVAVTPLLISDVKP
ncbi:MAG: alpha/beta hydrolase [Deltaproteobacteria bacterium]|nr:alpha/beta hydrolase [Deltaproteobacteria bacterium]